MRNNEDHKIEVIVTVVKKYSCFLCKSHEKLAWAVCTMCSN